MSQQNKRFIILAAAISAALFTAGSGGVANAQYRIDNGNVLDANNRVGAGGLNEGGGRPVGAVTGNQIITGNVTGGKQFRGFVPYKDPHEFEGRTAAAADDRFIRDTNGTPYANGGLGSNAQVTQPFYGASGTVQVPQGFVKPSVGNGSYVQAPPETRLGSDLRLGNPLNTTIVQLPPIGETTLPGPVDTSTNNATLYTASSLYGVRQWNAGNEADQQFISRYSNAFGETTTQPPGSLSDLEIGAMRREMQQAAGANVNNNNVTPQPTDTLGNPQQNQGANPNDLNRPVGTPLNAPDNSALQNGQLNPSLQSNAIQNNVNTGEAMRSYLLVPPAQQSQANSLLQQRLDEANGVNSAKPMSDEEAARQYNQQLTAQKAAQAKAGGNPAIGQPGQPGQPAVPLPGAIPHGPLNPSSPLAGNPSGGGPSAPMSSAMSVPNKSAAPNRKPPPVIKSFSEGVKAKGLGDLLKQGEGFMKQGKWYSAIEQYDLAQEVAPNNMLILVGRANAELGGSYYSRAEADLRTAFTQDQATLEGQFDLRSMIGDDRLAFLVKDLKDVSSKNPTQARPVFLLAYISYNTGNERMAAGYLDLAEKRAGGGDTFYTLVRSHWNLPAKTAAPELNK